MKNLICAGSTAKGRQKMISHIERSVGLENQAVAELEMTVEAFGLIGR